MKLIVFDVGNAACSVVSSPNKYALMIDCGSSSEKPNPADLFNANKKWLETQPFTTKHGTSYELTLLHITHPDDDHVRNAKHLKENLPPYLLRRRRYEEYPNTEQINQDYKTFLDIQYRGSDPEEINWGFHSMANFQIPMETIINDVFLNKKIKNNSSILKYIEYFDTKILFTGDMENEGWDWICKNDAEFIATMRKGIDILIAPHHGHSSGFPTPLFDLTGNVRLIIHSKGSEGNIDGTDVSTQYSNKADGVTYTSINNNLQYTGKVLTTRSNGNIYIQVYSDCFSVWTEKASPNHEKN